MRWSVVLILAILLSVAVHAQSSCPAGCTPYANRAGCYCPTALPPCVVSCASACVKVHTSSYCGCSCPSTYTGSSGSSTPTSTLSEEDFNAKLDEIEAMYEEAAEIRARTAQIEVETAALRKEIEELEEQAAADRAETEKVNKETDALIAMNEQVDAGDMAFKIIDCDDVDDTRFDEISKKVMDRYTETKKHTGYPVLTADSTLYTINMDDYQFRCYGFEEVDKEAVKKAEEESKVRAAEIDRLVKENEQLSKENQAYDEMQELLKAKEYGFFSVPCEGITDARYDKISDTVKEYDSGGRPLLVGEQLYFLQKEESGMTCLEFHKKFSTVTEIPEITREQLDFVAKETKALREEVKQKGLAADLLDSFKTSVTLYDLDFEWAPGLNVQISSRPDDVAIWGAKVIANPAVQKLKGKIIKKVLSEDKQDLIKNTFTVVEKHDAFYEVQQPEGISGDHVVGPFTVRIFYAPEKIPDGYTEDDLGMFHFAVKNGVPTYSKLKEVYVDKVKKAVIGKTDGFSTVTVGVLHKEKESFMDIVYGLVGIIFMLGMVILIIGGPIYLAIYFYRKKHKKHK